MFEFIELMLLLGLGWAYMKPNKGLIQIYLNQPMLHYQTLFVTYPSQAKDTIFVKHLRHFMSL